METATFAIALMASLYWLMVAPCIVYVKARGVPVPTEWALHGLLSMVVTVMAWTGFYYYTH